MDYNNTLKKTLKYFQILGNIRQRYVQRVNTNQIQMVTPQKVMQPAGMVPQNPRFQTPIQNVRAPVNQTLRTPRPRAIVSPRMRTPINVRPALNTVQHMGNTSSPVMNQRPRLTLTRLTTSNQVNQIQPIISVGTPKNVVSITSPPRGPIVRTPTQVYQKQSPSTQHIQASPSPSTSNSSIATEDLEDSIQAARITKQTTNNFTIVQPNTTIPLNEANDNQIVTLQSGTQMSVAEYKQRQASQAAQAAKLSGIKPMQRAVVQNRQPRFASPNLVRTQRPVMVSPLELLLN